MRIRMVLSYVLNMVLFHSSRNTLRLHWSPRTEFPCQNILWTCEHVVPKSIIPEHNDLHNPILLPDRLNHARSNFPYIQGIGYDNVYHAKVKPILPCQQRGCSCHDLQGKLVSKNLFIPPDRFKGMIGRSVLCMKDKYPHHSQLIHRRVLDLGLASIWDTTFPPSDQEKEWDEFVASCQGDHNPYVFHYHR